jgi:DNA-binding IclR family transcriptional regulator
MKHSGSRDRTPYQVQAVVKAVAIFAAFEEEERLSLAELAVRVQLPKPTVFRLAATLQQAGLLERRLDGSYGLGLRFVSIARLVLARGLPRTAQPFMEELLHSYGHTVNLAVPEGGEMLFVEILESRHNLRVVSPVGAREPLHASAIGKAVAAQLSSEELARVLAEHPLRSLTPKTITSRAKLEEELVLTRERGFSTDSGECRVGSHCIGAPVFDLHGVVGAISLSATSEQLPTEDFAIVGRAVSKAAKGISEALGAGRQGFDDARREALTAGVGRG